MSKRISQNPWAGLASYADPEKADRKLKFCGRDDESYDLAKLIENNVFVTLYGKSGIGKTSLLNAGVFPELREGHFTPISLRLGMKDKNTSYQSILVENIALTASTIKSIDVVPEQKDFNAVDYLWNYFARHRFFDKNGEETTIVFILDQFEEVFRNGSEEVEILLRQIDYINDKNNRIDKVEIEGEEYEYHINYRFVVSIREDDLYRLEDSLDNCYLPALKRCRYRLRSLSEEGAIEAILLPGEGLFHEEDKKNIAAAIIAKSRNADGSISTNIISLLCSRIFTTFNNSNADNVSLALVESFIKGNPFEKFYKEATREFSNKEKSYIEDHLIDSTGRRNSVPESDFIRKVKHGEVLLDGDLRILQRTSVSSYENNYRIELIHDSFCEPLAELKRKRLQRRRAALYTVIISVVLLCFGIAMLIFSQKSVISQREKELEAKGVELETKNAQLEQKNSEIENEKKEAILAYEERSKAYARLDSANREILRNAEELDRKSAELETKNAQLEQKNISIKIENALVGASEAKLLASSGNPMLALENVRKLYKNLAKDSIYLPELEEAARAAYDSIHFVSNKKIGVIQAHASFVRDMCYSHDGKIIATCSNDKTIALWDAETGNLIRKWRAHSNLVSEIAFSNDDQYIISGSYVHDDKEVDGTVKIWETNTGNLIDSIPSNGETIGAVCFNGDGTKVAAISWEGRLIVYNLISKTYEIESFLPISSTPSIALNEDGTKLVYAIQPYNEKGEIGVIDVNSKSRRVLLNVSSNQSLGEDVAFSPDYKYLAGMCNDSILIWDNSFKLIKSLTLNDSTDIIKGLYSKLRISEDGKSLVALYEIKNKEVYQTHVWNVHENKMFFQVQTLNEVSEFSPFVNYEEIKYLTDENRSDVSIWSLCSKKPKNSLSAEFGWVEDIAYLQEENTLLCVEDSFIYFVKDSDSFVIQYDGHCDLLRNGKECVISDNEGWMKFADLSELKWERKLKIHDFAIEDVEISKDGERLVSIDVKGRVLLLDYSTGDILDEFWMQRDTTYWYPRKHAISDDCEWFVYNAGAQIHARNFKTSNNVCWSVSPKSEIMDMDICSNKGYVALIIDKGVYEYAIEIWDIASQELIKTIPDIKRYKSIAYSHNGQYVAIGTYDGGICIYETNSYKKIYTDRIKHTVDYLAFTADDKGIISRGFTSELWSVKVSIHDFIPFEEIIK